MASVDIFFQHINVKMSACGFMQEKQVVIIERFKEYITAKKQTNTREA